MEDVLKTMNRQLYTGVPFLSCLQLLSELLRPEAEKLKYLDKNNGKAMKYQTCDNKKQGPKRVLRPEEEFVLTLDRLRLRLMGRHLTVTNYWDCHYLGVFLFCYFQRNITLMAN